VGNGAFPPREAIQSNTKLAFCAVPSALCMSPLFLSAAGGQTVMLSGGPTPFSMECIVTHGISLKCKFANAASENVYVLADAAPTIDTMQNLSTLTCTAPALAWVETKVSIVQVGAYPNQTEPFLDVYLDPSSKTTALIVPAGDGRLAAPAGICATCGLFLPTYCWKDCSGAYRGEALLDDCLSCAGGTTGRTKNQDQNCREKCFLEQPALKTDCLCNGNGTKWQPLSFHEAMTGEKRSSHPMEKLRQKSSGVHGVAGGSTTPLTSSSARRLQAAESGGTGKNEKCWDGRLSGDDMSILLTTNCSRQRRWQGSWSP
jgi:hypothetical protein